MLLSVIRASASSSVPSLMRVPTVAINSCDSNKLCVYYSSKTKKPSKRGKSLPPTESGGLKDKKHKSKTDSKTNEVIPTIVDTDSESYAEEERARKLDEDEKDKSLDVGPNGRPLFTFTPSISHLSKEDACTYMKFDMEKLEAVLPEGLPQGMLKEFEDSRRSALLIRQSFLDLRDNFRRIVDPPLHSYHGPKIRKQIVLDGPVSCGKSIALAMLVHWARDEGFIVFYVPKGKEWTHAGFYSRNPQTGFLDTPSQATKVLQDFVKANESHIKQLSCQINDSIPLGEGPGIGLKKGVDSMLMPEDSTLYDLVQTGLDHSHAAVGVVVRLRKELSLVKDIPVLFAIDQYNSWFTFSAYEEPVTLRSCRPIHAKELAMVNAFRCMMHNEMMVGAFSHSTAVGKLRQQLPDVPVDARVNLPRYTLDEAATVSHYYLRQRMVRREVFSEDAWKKVYFLSNGNGSEMRWLTPLMR